MLNLTRGQIAEMIARGKPLDKAIRAIDRSMGQCAQFFPWPALIESWREDIERMKQAAARQKGLS